MTRLLALAALLPAVALGGWRTAAAPSAKFETAKPASGVNVDTCPCGGDGSKCVCPPGECRCPGCLVKAEEHTERAAALVKGTAPLTIRVTPNCPPGAEAERVIVPMLAAQRWQAGKHYRVVRAEDGPCPQFFWKGKAFATDGWHGWESWRADLAGAMGLQAEATVRSGSVRPSSTGVRAGAVTTWAVNPRPAAAPVRLPGQHSHRCSSCGTIWSHGSDSHGSYRDHQCPNCGRLQWQQYRGPMNGGYVRSAPVMRYQPIVMRSCPNGRCP
jgi:DNA-directed RNA polymerase subunit RPC12/RpoP